MGIDDEPSVRRPGKSLVVLLAFPWVLLVGSGMALLSTYENQPGPAAQAPGQWPAESRLTLAPGALNLVMLAHPRCPCTRASIGELARLMARTGDRIRAHVVFYRPDDSSDDWSRTDLWTSAASIPGVECHDDVSGVEASLFGGVTSGHAIVYDGRGALRFSGGLTASRGHSGDSVGLHSITALASDGVPSHTRTPVFGCDLDGAPGSEDRRVVD